MKISKNRLKEIIMQEVKNIMETKKGEDKKTGRKDDKAYVADKDQKEDEGGHRTGEEAYTTKKGMKKKTGKGKAYEGQVQEDYDYTEEKHDDMDMDHLRRIRDDINRHIDALEDQHRRVKDYEDRKDD